jgi:hypothetical protein
MPRRFLYLVATAAGVATASGAAPAISSPPQRPTPVVVQTSRGGFDWADAAIGAASATGLIGVAAGVLFLKGDRNAE